MGAKDTYNPYPEEERKKVSSEAWIFTERLRFTSGLSWVGWADQENDAPSKWEQHLAEISFKAGYKEGNKDTHKVASEIIEGKFEEGREAGIKEMMKLEELITHHILQAAIGGGWYIESQWLKAFWNARQAKLKELRIK